MYHRESKFQLHKRLGTPARNSDKTEPGNLYASCRFMLLLGRLIGLIPFEFGWRRSCTATVETSGKIGRILGLTIMTLLAAQTVVGFQSAVRSKFVNAADYFQLPHMFAFYAIGTFLYWHFHYRAHKLELLFQHWVELKCRLTQPDRTLTRDVNIITGILMGSTVLENLMNNLRYSQYRDDLTDKCGYDLRNESFLRIYYAAVFPQWTEWVSYSWPVALYGFLSDKLTWYAWNLADILVLVSSRALYMKFKSLYECSEVLILKVRHEGYRQECFFWKQITQDHHALWLLVQEFQEFLSPLIFISIAMNTYFICTQIHFGLSDSTNVTALDNVYAVWSLGHLVLRVYLICLAGSKVHEWAHKVILLLQRCPSHAISLDVIRTERCVNRAFIGWTGLDSFWVTNELLMKVVWVILTFGIVVLQASEKPKHSSSSQSICKQ